MTVMAPEQTSGIAAGRPQPQTTIEAPGGPFIRHTQDGRRIMYNQTNVAYGGVVNNPMVASPGYNKGYRVKFSSTGGTGGGTGFAAGAAQLDGIFTALQLIQIKDAYGTVLYTGPGWEMAFLVPLVNGQFGVDESAEETNLPSTAATSTTNATFKVPIYFAFEFAKAYGVVSGANASLLPTMQANFATLASVFAGAVTGAPVLNWQVESDFYWLPQGVAVVPPGIGTTCQWVFQPCSPTFALNANTLVQAPRLGGYLTTLACEIRDQGNANVRVDNWPASGNRLRVYVDGVPLIDSDWDTLLDDMAISTMLGSAAVETTPTSTTLGARMVTRPTGVFNISRKTSLSQRAQGLLESGEIFLSTNPGTQIEFAGAPFGGNGTGPFVINVMAGQVVPSGVLIQGLPEV